MSGLRNPPAAVRGVAAGSLAAMMLVLLMAIVPFHRLGDPAAMWVCVGLAAVALVLLGLLKQVWTWYAALVIPVALLAAGWLHWALSVLGVLFALLWCYVLNVRRTVLGRD
jgi:hypothetical protein